MTPDNDSRDDEEQPDGLLGAIRLMVDTLVDAEREGKTSFGKRRRVPGDHFTTEYGFSGQIGGPRNREDSGAGQNTGWSSSSGSGGGGESDDSYRVDIREGDDELLVVADMPDVDHEDITVGIDEDSEEFVVGVGDQAVERMEPPWPVEDVQAQYRHGILELRLRRGENE